eukprot:CAMPEP_0184493068 /NCGR_PEP_ID=MMETSP0113_2-20130426/25025_1 /TAXON_ID=91329 /ORGANISM="Norrisiella sphaerica, Strain BC52" /LENGTH=245 /DNA_ID=CAMNT_0026878193 /DNA_START=839 /DNA_END=1576 /DNA_ORIENTATION=-
MELLRIFAYAIIIGLSAYSLFLPALGILRLAFGAEDSLLAETIITVFHQTGMLCMGLGMQFGTSQIKGTFLNSKESRSELASNQTGLPASRIVKARIITRTPRSNVVSLLKEQGNGKEGKAAESQSSQAERERKIMKEGSVNGSDFSPELKLSQRETKTIGVLTPIAALSATPSSRVPIGKASQKASTPLFRPRLSPMETDRENFSAVVEAEMSNNKEDKRAMGNKQSAIPNSGSVSRPKSLAQD